MKKKKILLLGGSAQQVIAIITAKRLGFYTILCDYLEDNPGQHVADQFYMVSTINKEAVLKIAQKEKIEGVLAYASDPAAPTAAYIAEQLNLPGNPYNSVEILCNKDYFRLFLKENGFFTPNAYGYIDLNAAFEDLQSGRFCFPVIVKPVDSSGSKGVGRIDTISEAQNKLKYAMSFSHKGRIIIEEYVEKYGYQIAGDGFSVDGKLMFCRLANDHFDFKSMNPFVPISASFPYNMPEEIHKKIQTEIQKILKILNMKTTSYNFDIRIDKDYNVYLMEIAPRAGGNYIPQVIQYAAGVDLVECSVKAALGEYVDTFPNYSDDQYWSYYAVHSLKEGFLDTVKIDPIVLKRNIIEQHFVKKKGDKISSFNGANDALGCLIMRFDSMEEMLDRMDHSEKWCQVRLMN